MTSVSRFSRWRPWTIHCRSTFALTMVNLFFKPIQDPHFSIDKLALDAPRSLNVVFIVIQLFSQFCVTLIVSRVSVQATLSNAELGGGGLRHYLLLWDDQTVAVWNACILAVFHEAVLNFKPFADKRTSLLLILTVLINKRSLLTTILNKIIGALPDLWHIFSMPSPPPLIQCLENEGRAFSSGATIIHLQNQHWGGSGDFFQVILSRIVDYSKS